MPAAYEPAGLVWENRNFKKYLRELERINRAEQRLFNSRLGGGTGGSGRAGGIVDARTISRASTQTNIFNQATQRGVGIQRASNQQTAERVGLLARLSGTLHDVGRASGGYYTHLGRGAQAAAELTGGLGAATAASLGLAAGIGAVVGVTASFFALARRGAASEGLIEAFQRTGVDLDNLREKSKGYISDLTLMSRTNLALTGTTGELRKVLGERLGNLVEIAGAQARDTGQDAQFLFNSLIDGIKRTSPRLIDNTGLLVKVGAANRAYAAELGKTVQELTAQEQQVALLNATIEAGSRSVAENADAQETAAQKLQEITATITNTLDRAGHALQPLFRDILDGVLGFIEPLEEAGPAIGATLSDIVRTIGQVGHGIGQLVRPLKPVAELFFNVFKEALRVSIEFGREFLIGTNQWIGDFQGRVSGVFSTLPEFVQESFGLVTDEAKTGGFNTGNAWIDGFVGAVDVGILGPIPALLVKVGKLFIGSSPPPEGPLRNIDVGGYNTGAAWANDFNSALYQGYLTSRGIAGSIADLFVGFSPPREGPLRLMDVGGRNTALAWIDGFLSADLQPFDTVAGNVLATMGDISRFTQEQVTDRIKELDRVQDAYNDQLAITRARFDALRVPAERAIDTIDRHITRNLQAIIDGDQSAAALARQFDMRRDQIYAAVDAQQLLVDEGEVQLALIKAQQAEERVLLGIRNSAFEKQKKDRADLAGAAGEGLDLDELDPSVPSLGGFESHGFNFFAQLEAERLAAYLNAGGDPRHLEYFQFDAPTVGPGIRRIDEDNLVITRLVRGVERSRVHTRSDLEQRYGRGELLGADRVLLERGPTGPFTAGSSSSGGLVQSIIEDLEDFQEAVGDAVETHDTGMGNIETKSEESRRILGEIIDDITGFFTGDSDSLKQTLEDYFVNGGPGSAAYQTAQFTGNWERVEAEVAIIASRMQDEVDKLQAQAAKTAAAVEATVNTHVANIIALEEQGKTTVAQMVQQFADLREAYRQSAYAFAPPPMPDRFAQRSIPAFASGGITDPGYFIAGERGPELIFSPRSLAVLPNSLTRAMQVVLGVMDGDGRQIVRGLGGGGAQSTVNHSTRVINNSFSVPNNVDLVRRLRLHGIG